MDEGRGPVKELEKRTRPYNPVSAPMDKGTGPVKELE
jgi:hypothetical protein